MAKKKATSKKAAIKQKETQPGVAVLHTDKPIATNTVFSVVL